MEKSRTASETQALRKAILAHRHLRMELQAAEAFYGTPPVRLQALRLKLKHLSEHMQEATATS